MTDELQPLEEINPIPAAEHSGFAVAAPIHTRPEVQSARSAGDLANKGCSVRSSIRVFMVPFSLLLLSGLAFGSSTISGKLVLPNGAGASPGWVQFDLVNCGGNFPTV